MWAYSGVDEGRKEKAVRREEGERGRKRVIRDRRREGGWNGAFWGVVASISWRGQLGPLLTRSGVGCRGMSDR
jgi:hypothetical protein